MAVLNTPALFYANVLQVLKKVGLGPQPSVAFHFLGKITRSHPRLGFVLHCNKQQRHQGHRRVLPEEEEAAAAVTAANTIDTKLEVVQVISRRFFDRRFCVKERTIVTAP